jgi:hypothetical protein
MAKTKRRTRAKTKAKTKAKNKPKTKAALPALELATVAGDPCNTGEEIKSSVVTVLPNGRVELRMAVCGASAPTVVDFNDKRVLSQTVSGPVVLPLMAPAAPGDYLLIWAHAPVPGTKWRVQGEVATQAADAAAQLLVQFRMRKREDGANPVPKFVVIVRVHP